MKAYKLTDSDGRTKLETQWGENIAHSAKGQNKHLCSDGWIHFYTDTRLAVVINPSHADFHTPLLWECETSGKHIHEPLKSGCKTLTTIRKIPLPEISLTQKIAFAILSAKEVYFDSKWVKWADGWLSGEDRSRKAALAAALDAADVASINAYAALAAARAVFDAASIDAYVAHAALDAASIASIDAYAARAARDAASIDAYVAHAADAAADATARDKTIDFVTLMDKAMTYK